MLHEIDCCKLKLDNARHSRIRGGVLSIHSNEIVQFQRTHGPWILTHFEDSLFDSCEPTTKLRPQDENEQQNFGEDPEFAAIIAAEVQKAGFDSSLVVNDPKYHTRTSRPESEDERDFSPRSKWTEKQSQRRDVSPGDSVSQATRRRGRNHDAEYNSDDEDYYPRETRDQDHPYHRRHLAEGALVEVGAAELLRAHRKREGEEVSHDMSHAIPLRTDDFRSLMLRWTTLDKSELDQLDFFSTFDVPNVSSFEVHCTS
ncbi:uncharacterized protein N7483_010992 [Penicillium malachiteum]|uniref:uncharacterized protein n=1 Tax=Penicillium malachiteum TaxID=1324776 RepID=UPI00254977D6|nr:uncharacterized protein N7483_010992 [Penicillium malachiteum]KAJ5713811.1 hypothetical protein N7483_010992 [Penicillium malachiteum]